MNYSLNCNFHSLLLRLQWWSIVWSDSPLLTSTQPWNDLYSRSPKRIPVNRTIFLSLSLLLSLLFKKKTPCQVFGKPTSSNTPNLTLNSSGDPRDNKYVRPNSGGMGLKWCVRRVQYFFLMEWLWKKYVLALNISLSVSVTRLQWRAGEADWSSYSLFKISFGIPW